MWTICCRRVQCRKRPRAEMSLTCQVSSRWRWSTDPPRSHCVSLALGSWGASSDRTRGLRSVWRKPTGGKSSEKKYAHKLAKVACWMLTTFIQPPLPPQARRWGQIVGRAAQAASTNWKSNIFPDDLSSRSEWISLKLRQTFRVATFKTLLLSLPPFLLPVRRSPLSTKRNFQGYGGLQHAPFPAE